MRCAILVGGGLQNGLVALAMRAARPDVEVVVVEAGPMLGGDHTWCFHVPPEGEKSWIRPLVVARWGRWQVSFPELERTFDGEYACVTSSRLHEVVSRAVRVELGHRATHVGANAVTLDDGRVLEGDLVIDARGPLPIEGRCGYQKFFGLELELASDAPFEHPLVMDAEVEQTDGFRFFYVLPFSRRHVLIEDTYFSDDTQLDEPTLERGILDYAARHGLHVARIVRRERGILPLPLTFPFSAPAGGPLVAGYGGGFFHPTTGYSFPIAARLAEAIAASPRVGPELVKFFEAHARQARYGVLLNKLLFAATPPEHRRDVLERFHRFPEDVVRRFYALETTSGDRLRILCGKPPRGVSLRQALHEVMSP